MGNEESNVALKDLLEGICSTCTVSVDSLRRESTKKLSMINGDDEDDIVMMR